MSTKSRLFLLCLAASALATPALAQQKVYPLKKQSQEQQKQDEALCLTWAMQQTGFDPAKPWFAPQPAVLSPTAGSSSVRFRSGVAGAAPGARRDAGDAAVAGAIIAASTQPAAGTTKDAIARREARMTIAGTGSPASSPSGTGAAAGAMTGPDTGATAARATGAASTPPAASAAASAIIGHDASNVIVGGAVAGATVRRDINPKITLQQEQAASQQQLAGQESFEKVRAACLEARGYIMR